MLKITSYYKILPNKSGIAFLLRQLDILVIIQKYLICLMQNLVKIHCVWDFPVGTGLFKLFFCLSRQSWHFLFGIVIMPLSKADVVFVSLKCPSRYSFIVICFGHWSQLCRRLYQESEKVVSVLADWDISQRSEIFVTIKLHTFRIISELGLAIMPLSETKSYTSIFRRLKLPGGNDLFNYVVHILF